MKKKFGHSGGYDFDEYQQQQAMPAQQIGLFLIKLFIFF